MREQFDVPVVMIVYKRLEITKRSFEAIRKLQPKKLYIVADGAKEAADKEKVIAVREYLDSHIDWECEVHRNYADHNYGLRYRMPSGMKWVFESEDRAIFVEDDIEASENFFYYCKDLLEYYKDDDRVLMISGSNDFPDHSSFENEDVIFSVFSSIWGWACWKRSFELYDVNIRDWPDVRRSGIIKKLLLPKPYVFFKILFDDLQYHWYRTWGYQWTYMMFTGKGLGIVPRYNLVRNIGMGDADAEHRDDTAERIDYVNRLDIKEIKLPIKYPVEIKRNEKYDTFYQLQEYNDTISVLKKFKYTIRALYYEYLYRQIKTMEQDKAYLEAEIPPQKLFSEEEQSYNSGDKYHLISPKQMQKDVRAYRKYRQRKKSG